MLESLNIAQLNCHKSKDNHDFLIQLFCPSTNQTDLALIQEPYITNNHVTGFFDKNNTTKILAKTWTW